MKTDPSMSGTVVQSGEVLPLVEQADGLRRRDVMKDVVGPALTELFYPVYEPAFSEEEIEEIPAESEFPDVSNLVWGIERILKNRLDIQIDENPGLYTELEELRAKREEIFFDNAQIVKGAGLRQNLDDGINSSVMVPLVVAVDILRLENGERPGESSDILNGPVDYQAIIEIIQRDSFWQILSRLPKGPNGYLTGERSSPQDAFSPWPSGLRGESGRADHFFGFRKGLGEYRERTRLSIWEAYSVKNGQVVDLSYDFFRSAEEQRKEIGKRGAMVFSRDKHRSEDSSGCPVRHVFDGYQESLIESSQKFLIAALEVASDRRTQAQARKLLELSETQTDSGSSPRIQQFVNWLLRRTAE